jgi:hypothetical protein
MVMMVGRRSESINSAVLNGEQINGRDISVYPCFFVKPQKVTRKSKAVLSTKSDGRIGYITDAHKVLRCGKDARHLIDPKGNRLYKDITGGRE